MPPSTAVYIMCSRRDPPALALVDELTGTAAREERSSSPSRRPFVPGHPVWIARSRSQATRSGIGNRCAIAISIAGPAPRPRPRPMPVTVAQTPRVSRVPGGALAGASREVDRGGDRTEHEDEEEGDRADVGARARA